MPIVHITWSEGRTEEQKAKVVKAFTAALVEHANVTPERVFVLIHDLPRTNIGNRGRLFSQPNEEPEAKK